MTTDTELPMSWWDHAPEKEPRRVAPQRAPAHGAALRGLSRTLLVLMFVLPITGALAGWAVASVTPTRYTAHSYLLIVDASDGAGASAVNVAQATARVATKPSVLAGRGGDVTLLAAAAEEDLTATASPDAPLVDLAASAGTAEEAVRLANELSDHVNRHISRFSESTRVESEVFAEASLPSKPASPNTLVNVIAGLAVGVLAASVLFVVGRR